MIVKNCPGLIVPDDETVVWKYMDFPKFLNMVVNETLWFNRLDKFTDLYEGELPEENKRDRLHELSKTDPSMGFNERLERVSKEAEKIRKYKEFTFANCWSLSEEESFALWKIYLGRSDNGVAIKSTVGRLKKCFVDDKKEHELYIGKVQYNEAVPKVDVFQVSGTKKPFYKYEEELRLFIFDLKGVASMNNRNPIREINGPGIEKKINLGELIDNVVLSPYSENWLYQLTIKILGDYLQKKVIVQKSQIKES